MKKVSELCCECNSCIAVCPVDAVSIATDKFNNKARVIDESKCIGCKKCEKACPVTNPPEMNTPKIAYAAISTNEQARLSSASAGAVYVLAREIINREGIVFGAAYCDNLSVQHIAVDNIDDLKKIQGSKYVKSDVADSYKNAREALRSGRWVMYTGTPCQIAGLIKFLGKGTDQSRLVTVDIICHGTPPKEAYLSFIDYYQKKHKLKIAEICFRDKAYGQKNIGYIKDTKGRKHIITSSDTSYYWLFSKGLIFNKVCYSCQLAAAKRASDITAGDYWGARQLSSEFVAEHSLDADCAISAVLVNTTKGEELISAIKELVTYEVDYEKIRQKNPQLDHPVACNQKEWEELMGYIEGNSYEKAEQYFRKHTSVKRYKDRLLTHLPKKIRTKL